MKKYIMILLMLIITSSAFSQVVPKYDSIIDEGIYKSYYSYTVKGPAFVIYKLWHGGGECSRKTMEFHGDLPHYDYRGSGYDKGHMANAEDFAYDCNKEKLTFNYINALPQNPILNRGPWKSMETKVRNSSWTDSLLIVCGGTDFVGCIPSKCFKIVYSLTTHKLLYATIFNNVANYGDVYFANYRWFGNIFDNVLDEARKEPTDNYVYITDFIRRNITENYQNFFTPEEMPWFKANMVNTIFNNWKNDEIKNYGNN